MVNLLTSSRGRGLVHEIICSLIQRLIVFGSRVLLLMIHSKGPCRCVPLETYESCRFAGHICKIVADCIAAGSLLSMIGRLAQKTMLVDDCLRCLGQSFIFVVALLGSSSIFKPIWFNSEIPGSCNSSIWVFDFQL